MSGRYWSYTKASGELIDRNLLFSGKVSRDLNCWMEETRQIFEASPGNFTEKTVYHGNGNLTKGEVIEYAYSFSTNEEKCYNNTAFFGSIKEAEYSFWRRFKY